MAPAARNRPRGARAPLLALLCAAAGRAAAESALASEVAATSVKARPAAARAVSASRVAPISVAPTKVGARAIAPTSVGAHAVAPRAVRPTPIASWSRLRTRRSLARGKPSKTKPRRISVSAAAAVSERAALYNVFRGCMDACVGRSAGKAPPDRAARRPAKKGALAGLLERGAELLMPMARMMSLALPPPLSGPAPAAANPVLQAPAAFPRPPAAQASPRPSPVQLVTAARADPRSVAGVLRPEDGKAFEPRLPAAGGTLTAGKDGQIGAAVREGNDLIRRGLGAASVPSAGEGEGLGAFRAQAPSAGLAAAPQFPVSGGENDFTLYQLVMAWASGRAAAPSGQGETAAALVSASFDGGSQRSSVLAADEQLGDAPAAQADSSAAGLLAQEAEELFAQDRQCGWAEAGAGEELGRRMGALSALADQLMAKNCWIGHAGFFPSAECRELMGRVAEACRGYNAELSARSANCIWRIDSYQPMACPKEGA